MKRNWNFFPSYKLATNAFFEGGGGVGVGSLTNNNCGIEKKSCYSK